MRARRSLVALAFAGAVLAACSEDDEASLRQSFCDEAQELLDGRDDFVEGANDAIDELADEAPSAIEDDIQEILDASRDAASDVASSEEVQDAVDRIDRYLDRECGIEK